jgi:hypothetical protein
MQRKQIVKIYLLPGIGWIDVTRCWVIKWGGNQFELVMSLIYNQNIIKVHEALSKISLQTLSSSQKTSVQKS